MGRNSKLGYFRMGSLNGETYQDPNINHEYFPDTHNLVADYESFITSFLKPVEHSTALREVHPQTTDLQLRTPTNSISERP